MSIGLFDNVGQSFGFAFENTFKKFLRWIGLSIVLCIPIVNWIATGIFLKIYRNEEPSFDNAGKSFIQGFLLFLIQLIYMIIPFIIMMLTVGVSIIPAILSGDAAAAEAIVVGGSLIGIVLTLIISILFCLIMAPAEVNFARKQSFGAAFAFGELFGMIGKLGWGKYILAWIVLILVTLVYGIILGLLVAIPIIGWIISLLSMPLFVMFYTKYMSNLFE